MELLFYLTGQSNICDLDTAVNPNEEVSAGIIENA